MKQVQTLVWVLCLLTFGKALGQKAISQNFYNEIKSYNLCHLWHAANVHMDGIEGDRGRDISFPEPLGYIGDKYQRFYIHYNTVVKDAANPYRYFVSGKTRVGNNVCSFKGTITIVKSVLYKPQSKQDKPGRGTVIGTIDFKEDSTQQESGFFKGTLTTDFRIINKNNLVYDTVDAVSDGYCNNQCVTTWTSYATHRSKKCNWGDWRIPQCGDLDVGAGEFGVNEKYISNGWQSLNDVDNKDKTVAKRAKAAENRKWW